MSDLRNDELPDRSPDAAAQPVSPPASSDDEPVFDSVTDRLDYCDAHDFYYDSDALEEEGDYWLDRWLNFMETQHLAQSTMDNHYRNVQTFLHYLAGYEGGRVRDTPYYACGYLGNYFIRKCSWSTPSSISTTATSLRRFCAFLVQEGCITKAASDEMSRDIRENIDSWKQECAEYNSGSMPFSMDEVLFF